MSLMNICGLITGLTGHIPQAACMFLYGFLTDRQQQKQSVMRPQFTEKDAHEFNQWAFGYDYHKLHETQLVGRFNSRHGNTLWINETGNYESNVQPMVLLWARLKGYM